MYHVSAFSSMCYVNVEDKSFDFPMFTLVLKGHAINSTCIQEAQSADQEMIKVYNPCSQELARRQDYNLKPLIGGNLSPY
jgi:hypothetical protein